MTNRIVYLVGRGTKRSQGQQAPKERAGGERNGCTGRVCRETPGPVFGGHKRKGLEGKKGRTGKRKKKSEGAAMFGWHVGAAVREDRSPMPGRGRRLRFWCPRVKGVCSRAGTHRVPVLAGQGSTEHRMMGQQVKWRVHGSGAAEEEEERAAAWCRLR